MKNLQLYIKYIAICLYNADNQTRSKMLLYDDIFQEFSRSSGAQNPTKK